MNRELVLSDKRTDFVIVPEQVVELDDMPFVIRYIASIHGTCGDDYYLGAIVGNPHKDMNFRKRKERIDARLMLNNVTFHCVWSRVNQKAQTKRTDMQKYSAKKTKLTNEYNKRKEAIMQSGDIFSASLLAELEKSFNEAINILNAKFCM
jgi:hypothetical protein